MDNSVVFTFDECYEMDEKLCNAVFALHELFDDIGDKALQKAFYRAIGPIINVSTIITKRTMKARRLNRPKRARRD